MNRLHIIAIISALLLAGAVVWLLASRVETAPAEAPAGPAGPAAITSSAGAPVGQRRVYDLHWTASQARRLGDGPAPESSLEIEGRLELVDLSDRDGMKARVARLYDLKGASLVLFGQAVETSSLEDARALVTSSPDGALVGLATPDGSDPEVGHALWGLFSRLQLTSPGRRRETTPLGVREVRYAGQDGQLKREGLGYVSVAGIPDLAGITQKLAANTLFKLDPDERLRSLDDSETLALSDGRGTLLDSRSRLRVRLIESSRALSVPSTAGFVPRDAGSAADRASAAALTARARGVSRKNLLDTLKSFSGRGSLSDLPGWLWQASGRLLLEPALSRDIAETVISGDLDMHGKRLATDLLAGAAHPEAQAALRRIFDHQRREKAPELVELIQRAGFLSLPEPATVSFVRSVFESEQRTALHHASGYALGAMADKLWGHGQRDESRQLTDLLAAALERAGTPEERADVIRSMGNAGTEAVAEAILDRTDAVASVEREAAAAASRKLQTDRATRELIALLVDAHPSVQRAAINALRGRLDGQTEYERVRDAVLSGSTHPANDPVLVNLLQTGIELQPARQALEFILTRSGADPRLRARLRKLLAG